MIRAFFRKYAVFGLIGLLISSVVVVVVLGFGNARKQRTIDSLTAQAASLKADNAVLSGVIEDFVAQVDEQNRSIAVLEKARQDQKRAQADIEKRYQEKEAKWRQAYQFLWDGKDKNPEDICGSFFSTLDQYIQKRRSEIQP